MSTHERNSGQRGSADRSNAVISNIRQDNIGYTSLVSKHNPNDAWAFSCRVVEEQALRQIVSTRGPARWPVFTKIAFMLARFASSGGLDEQEVRWRLSTAAAVAEMHHFQSLIDAAFIESTRPQLVENGHG